MAAGVVQMAGRFFHHDEWGNNSRRTKRGTRAGWMVAGAVLIFAIGAVAGGVVRSRLAPQELNPVAPPVPTTGNSRSAQPSLNNSIANIYKVVTPSIFTITATSPGTKQTGPQEDIGTGFLIDNKGDIATNNHVVSGMSTVTVTIGSNDVTGEVIGKDTLDDLAIIKIPPPPNIAPLQLGTATDLQPGDPVIAIGNPFQLTLSVTSGIVSGLNRSMPTSSGHVMTGLVQVDAPINPGNSGGPLFNAAGQVVGIDWAIESPVQGSVGIGFAIPIDKLKSVLPQLLNGQKVQHPWIGIAGQDITPGLAQEFHLPVKQGILVVQVAKGGPAAIGGIHPDTGGPNVIKGDGDIIVAANGKPVASVADLTAIISTERVGSVIHLTILRHGQRMTINVRLQNWKQS